MDDGEETITICNQLPRKRANAPYPDEFFKCGGKKLSLGLTIKVCCTLFSLMKIRTLEA